MAKRKGNVFGSVVTYTKTNKGTSIGRNPITSTMSKHKKKGRSKTQIKKALKRGQGKP